MRSPRFLLLLVASTVLFGGDVLSSKLQGQPVTVRQAKIQDWSGHGKLKTRFLVVGIDGKTREPGSSDRIHALKPGTHTIVVLCQFRREGYPGITVDWGLGTLPLETKAGGRYRANGNKRDLFTAEIWLENLITGKAVTDIVIVQLRPSPE